MKVGDSRPVGGAKSVSGRTVSKASGPGSAVSAPRAIADTTSVMGVPEGELTPKVRQAIMALMEEVDNLRKQLTKATARLADLERLADQDTLVPLPNRRAFVRELSRVASYSQRYKAPASLIYFDVNGFKSINDRYGHAAGDAALLRVAQSLVENVRESDIVGRIGGDEFGVILVQVESDRAIEKAASLATAISSRPVMWEGQPLQVSAAYGVYALGGGEDPSEALAAADKAMYAHKQTLKAQS